jgi:hypothetical protein
MNRKIATLFSVIIILVFVGYMILDISRPGSKAQDEEIITDSDKLPEPWKISGELNVKEGNLKAVTVSPAGNIYLGGDSFIKCYDQDLNLLWNLNTPYPVTSLSYYGDTIFAATMEMILIVSSDGEIKEEWGPFEDNAIITSVTANSSFVAFSDAGNKMAFVLDRSGVVKTLIGQSGEQFILPSPYFDVALGTDNTLYIANTGHRRIETRGIDGELKSYFGEPGLAAGAFCGCCNPAHFILIPNGFVTAEKGINRIKILSNTGEFVEFVSSKNRFTASIPLDLASVDGKSIYAANPADSKLYIFTRK